MLRSNVEFALEGDAAHQLTEADDPIVTDTHKHPSTPTLTQALAVIVSCSHPS